MREEGSESRMWMVREGRRVRIVWKGKEGLGKEGINRLTYREINRLAD